MKFINLVHALALPTLLQLAGVAVFGIAVWKGVHGFLPTAGLILGAGMAYVGRHYATLWKV